MKKIFESEFNGFDDGESATKVCVFELEDVDEYYTISDKYNLDQEFENMYSRYHASIQEVFDSGKHIIIHM